MFVKNKHDNTCKIVGMAVEESAPRKRLSIPWVLPDKCKEAWHLTAYVADFWAWDQWISFCHSFLPLGTCRGMFPQPPPQSEAKLGLVIKEIAAPGKHKLPKVVSSTHFNIWWLEICSIYDEKILDKAVRNMSLEHNQSSQRMKAFLHIHSLTYLCCGSLPLPTPSLTQLQELVCPLPPGTGVSGPLSSPGSSQGWVMLYLEPRAMWAPSPIVIGNEGKMRWRCLKVLIKVKKWSLSISGAFFESSKHGDRLCCICHIFTVVSNTC